MDKNFAKLAEQNKAAVNSMLEVVTVTMALAERITSLNLATGREFVQDCANATKAILSSKDPQAAFAAASALVQPSVQKAVAYSKSLLEISLEAKEEVQKRFNTQYADFQKSAAKLVDEAAKSAPAGSESIVAAAKETVAQAHAALEAAKKIAESFIQSAQSAVESNVANVTQSADRHAK